MSNISYLYFPRGYRFLINGDAYDTSLEESEEETKDSAEDRFFEAPELLSFDPVPVRQDGVREIWSKGDKELMELFTSYRTSDIGVLDWSFKATLISLLAKRIPCINTFFNLQEKNPFVYDYNFNFLVELSKFISYGYKPTSPYTMVELINVNPKPSVRNPGSIPRVKNVSNVRSTNTNRNNSHSPSWISKFLSSGGSIDDMLWVGYILLGSTQR